MLTAFGHETLADQRFQSVYRFSLMLKLSGLLVMPW